MIGLKNMLGIIRTEANEHAPLRPGLPKVRFDLELIRFADGHLDWIESDEDFRRLQEYHSTGRCRTENAGGG